MGGVANNDCLALYPGSEWLHVPHLPDVHLATKSSVKLENECRLCITIIPTREYPSKTGQRSRMT
jgi:hypothetical protein